MLVLVMVLVVLLALALVFHAASMLLSVPSAATLRVIAAVLSRS
jgi:hypothetical protein